MQVVPFISQGRHPPDKEPPSNALDSTVISQSEDIIRSQLPVKDNVMIEEVNPRRNALRWCFASCAAFICFCPFISVICGLNIRARVLSYQPNPPPPLFNGSTVLKRIVLVNADPTLQTVTLDWAVMGEETWDISSILHSILTHNVGAIANGMGSISDIFCVHTWLAVCFHYPVMLRDHAPSPLGAVFVLSLIISFRPPAPNTSVSKSDITGTSDAMELIGLEVSQLIMSMRRS